MENKEILKRWRLILGSCCEDTMNSLGGAGAMSEEDMLMDSALSQIYGGNSDGSSSGMAGSGKSSPKLTKWLGDLRSLFSQTEIRIIQNDAIERCGLKQLLFEPEMLEGLAPDISTAALLLTLKEQIPARAKDNARRYIAKIVEDINRRLSDDLRRPAADHKKEGER